MIIWSGALTLCIVTSFHPAHPDVVERFDERTCAGPHGPVRYRLHVPLSADLQSSRSPSPLVVWFHGGGEAGEDNCEQLAWLELVFGSGSRQHAVEAYVLAVQFPAEVTSGQSPRTKARGPDERTDERTDEGEWDRPDLALHDVLGRHAIDRERIYLAGISQGGNRVWRYACHHRGRFAALLPMATGPIGERQVCDLKNVPIWAFQSTHDGPAQIMRMQQLVGAVGGPKGHASITVVDARSHDCWTAALGHYRAWRWLLDQRRGQRVRRFGQTVVGRYLSQDQAIAASLGLALSLAVTARLMARIRGYRLRGIS
jgi:predicted peptidase